MIIAGALLIGTSFYWPKLTGKPRPEVLEKVYEAVLGTKAGENAAVALGATDETPINPDTLRQAGNEAVSRAAAVVTEKTETIVVQKIVDELIKRYDILPAAEQTRVKEEICK